MSAVIRRVSAADLGDLLPLLRAYCEFYRVDPADSDLLGMCRALLGDPEREGVQFIARDGAGVALGFATVFWSWNTLSASRLAVMNDLYVVLSARGTGLADELIQACARAAAEHGAPELVWQTAKDNARAQAVYDRVGAHRSEWLDYALPVTR